MPQNNIVQSLETGRQAARQREEDAYTKARRPIENAFLDKRAELGNQAAEQNIGINAAQEQRAVAGEERTAAEQGFTDQSRVFAMASRLTDKLANDVEATGKKPSELLQGVPPEILKMVHLDSPEAQQHFAEVYDADPSQLRSHSQMYGSGRKIKSTEPVETDEGANGFLQTFEDGTVHFVPGYKSKKSVAGGFTIAGKRFDAAGNLITDESDAVAALAGATAQNRTVGTATGKVQAEDIAPSDTATRTAANDLVALQQRDADFQRAGNLAVSLIGDLSTGYAANLDVPGSPAYQLNAALDTMGAQLQTDEMLRLKQASKNGSTGFGSLTEKEGELLRSLQASIKAGQKKEVLAANIAQLQQVHAQRLKAQEAAFRETYGVDVAEGLKKGGRAAAAAGVPSDIQSLLGKYGKK